VNPNVWEVNNRMRYRRAWQVGDGLPVWGRCLVHEATEELLTTIVYAPGSFAPLIRIDQNKPYMQEQKSERELAMQEAMKQVEELLAAEGIELKKPPPDPRWIDVSFFVTDHAGTPMRLVNENGRVIWQAEPDDWGAVKNEKTFFQGDIRQPIRFQGQWLDEESGFYYNRYRFYDPRQGRYITQDPIGLEGEMNFYAYVGGDPVRFTDPLGLYKVHGKWCGPDWTGGRRHPYRSAPQGYYQPPISHTDAACERHDKCFATCRDLNPCDKNARSACMSECNAGLKSAIRFDSSSGTSIAKSAAIWIGMTISPDPGPNSPSCGCAK